MPYEKYPLHLTIKEAQKELREKKISAVELAKVHLSCIEDRDRAVHAYLEVFKEDALQEAAQADELLAQGRVSPLTGIPLAIKDNILIKGRRAGAASKILEGYKATYDAHVIEKLKAQAAVFLGRTNMDEFALGGSTENSAYGATRNPHDETRVAGGTSGGSAAAVAADMALGALGSDTGGSVRNPASFCGVVGLKPTYGAVSRRGLIAAVSSFDQIGPLAKTVSDAEILFDAIKGNDPRDSTSLPALSPQGKEVRRIGVPRHFLSDTQGLDEGVRSTFEEALKKLEGLGFTLVDIDFSSLSHALAAYYIINFAEVSTNLARFDGVRYGLKMEGKELLGDYVATRGEGFGREAKRRILLGTYVLSAGYYDAYYGKATSLRAHLTQDLTKVFRDVDLLATPTMPAPAFKLGEKGDPLSLYLEDIFTVPANLTGMPAISLPMGMVEKGGKMLPAGLQFMAPHKEEGMLFSAGKRFLGETA